MRWIAINGGVDRHMNASEVRSLHCREDENGHWKSYAIDHDGKEHETALDVLDIVAPPETVVPAQPGYYIAHAEPHEDHSISVELHPVVGWRIIEGIGLPITPAFSFEDEEHCALAGPGGVIRRLPQSTKGSGWGVSTKPLTLSGWLSYVAREAAMLQKALPAPGGEA